MHANKKQASNKKMTDRDLNRWEAIYNLHLSDIDSLVDTGRGCAVDHYNAWCLRADNISKAMGFLDTCAVCPLAGGNAKTLMCKLNGLNNRMEKLNFAIEHKQDKVKLIIDCAKKYKKKFNTVYAEWRTQNL